MAHAFRSFLYNFFVLLCCVFILFLPFVASSQSVGLEIAKTYVIEGSVPVESGDIISFDRLSQQFRLAAERGDENLFGIAVSDPLLVLESGNGGIPVVQAGEVFVNVTAQNGAINAGDYITSSSISGKGQKANPEDTYIIGVALDSFSGTEATSAENAVVAGSIRVLLSIGTQEQAAEVLFNEKPQDTGITEATILNIIQYFLAAFIAVGSSYIAFKNFGPNIKDGVVSIGRNPLAKSSIQSMIILNAVLIALVALGGLFIGLAILLLPI